MVNRYTADRRIRRDDAYTPGGVGGAAPRPLGDRLRAARARGVPATRRSSSAASKRACGASRTSTTGRRRCAARSCSTRAPTCSSTATPSARSSRSRTASRSASRSPASPTCAARRSRAARRPRAGSRSTPPRSTSQALSRRRSIRTRSSRRGRCRRLSCVNAFARARWCASSARSRTRCARRASCACPRHEAVRDDPVLYAHASRILHVESNPGQRARPGAASRRCRRVAQSAARFRSRRRRWMRSTSCRTGACRIPRYGEREDSRVRDDPLFDRDPARLLRRLHLLLDHRARGAHHPEPLGGIGDPRDRDGARHRARVHRRDLRPRRADREHVPPRVQEPRDRVGVPAAVVRLSGDLQQPEHRSRAAGAPVPPARAQCPASRRC